MQETLSKALRAFDSFQRGRISRRGYSAFCATRFSLRAPVSQPHVPYFWKTIPTLDMADAKPTPEDHLIRFDNQAAIHAALEQLQPPLREVLLLCDVEELKYKDIALILDVPIGTVMSRISRARRTLRQLLQPKFGGSA